MADRAANREPTQVELLERPMLRLRVEAAMWRRNDLILVTSFIAATGALVILTQTKRADAPSAPVERGPDAEQLAITLMRLVPELEEHVAAGSMKTRDSAAACVSDSRARTARIDGIERDVLEGTGYRRWTDPEARYLAEPLHDAMAPLRACVSCSVEKSGCADAARALVTLERRLAARSSIVFDPGGI